MTIEDSDLLELRDAVGDLDEALRRRPLSAWRPWDREAPRTSQRRELAALEFYRVNLIFGGNRSGKTEGLRAAAVALALGSDHPDAAAFWRAVGADPAAFPEGPGRVWIVALTSNDSIRYHRKEVLALIPKWGPRHPRERSQNWHAWQLDSKGESRLEVMVPGYSKPAEIVFKSEDQGEEAMQGDSARAILHDEEGGSPKTWNEAAVRLWDQDGWHLMSNTPVRGKTWVFDEFVRQKPEGVHVGWIHTLDNPWLPAKKRAELAAKAETDPVQAAIRQRGEFVALEGRVWPQFSRATHVIPTVPIPDSALRFRSIDFGTRDPFVCAWGALLRHPLDLPDGRTVPDGTLILYREHYQAGWTLAQHVERIRTAEGAKLDGDEWVGGETIEITWADPEDRQQLLQLNHTHNITAIKARKAVHAGISVVGERLSPDATGWPRLLVMDSCPHHIESIEGYMWAGSGRDEPAKGDDHCCDTTRYLSMGVRAGYE